MQELNFNLQLLPLSYHQVQVWQKYINQEDLKLIKFYNKNAATIRDAERANQFLQLLGRILLQNCEVQKHDFNIIKIHPYGSYKQSLSLSNSDVDICLEIQSEQSVSQQRILYSILEILKDSDNQANYQYTLKEGEVIYARSNFIKGEIKYNGNRIKFDLIINNMLSVYTSDLLFAYVKQGWISKKDAQGLSIYLLLIGFFEYAIQIIQSPLRINIVDDTQQEINEKQVALLFSFVDPFDDKQDVGIRGDLQGKCNKEIKIKFENALTQLQNKNLEEFMKGNQ